MQYRVMDLDCDPAQDLTVTLGVGNIVLDNDHGGTYIAHGKLSYNLGASGKQTATNVASGALKSEIELPSTATDIEYLVTFTSSKVEAKFNWPTAWENDRQIKVKGVWPGTPSATLVA